ncbi:hypothetical protein SOVF_154610 [Spinacia oleracea]|uniref:Ribosome-inactivating protein n=1 Tax=Spinacia oleracea TaxID=3562 RepID=A0A9R0I8T8_SPIOL|nr:abrin-a-like [Spinacia oleracea]KNA09328.1 hypothetical protein SOVF_154610 [Spinacia oleracea]
MRLLWVVITAWACWFALLVQPQHCKGFNQLNKGTFEKDSNLNVYTIRFNTDKATKDSYMKFIKDLYNALTDRADRDGDIPILPSSLGPNNPGQYVHVELSNGRRSVTLAIDLSNVYVMGIQAGNTAYFFKDVNKDIYKTVFPGEGIQREALPFTSQYGAMEGAAGVDDRREIPLGISRLGQQIDQVHNGGNRNIARALITMIQMVAEAVRFRNIEQKVVATIQSDSQYGEFYPDGLMLEWETSWGALSAAVQSAVDGIFPSAVQLNFDGGQVQVIETVRQILFFLSIMPLVCRRNYLEYTFSSSLSLPISRRGLQQEMSVDDKCNQVLEPKVHITGFDGFCVSVKDGDYSDGNSIVLTECKDGQENQVWSLRSQDQTIRSKGKCLTTYGYKQGNYVMIYDCDTAIPDATKWHIDSIVGKIKNPRSGLYLTADRRATGVHNLVIDHYQYASRQVWLPTNITTPSVNYIVGYRSLCVTQDGFNLVWMVYCTGNMKSLRWALYPDGTIRPEEHRGRCLQYTHGLQVISLGACGGWSNERWLFQVDGTILHVATGLLMDFIETSGLYQITLNDYTDSFSQIWFLTPYL